MEAKDCKCRECGQQAVAFWPVIDPDIPAQPYCRKCLDKAKIRLMIECFGKTQKEAEALAKSFRKIEKASEALKDLR